MQEIDKANDPGATQKNLWQVNRLLHKHKLIETLAHKQNLAELRTRLEQHDAEAVAQILEAVPHADREIIWQLITEERKEEILLVISDDVRSELVDEAKPQDRSTTIRVFDLYEGRLRQIPIASRADLARANPIWIDLVAPDDEQIAWARELFEVDLPNPKDLTDLETSARFYIEEGDEVHLHSDFLLDREDESRNVAVAFILHKGTLFSVRSEELPVFRLQRLRARAQSGYVSEAKDVLLDLYAADVEYSANALEDVYADLGVVGKQVLRSHITDDEAAVILASIAEEEDLNGRIRRNVLDTRRALSFLMRAKFLSEAQHENVREILRDIESLDGHTAFLFNKINFLMDATDSSININQNKDIKRLTIISVVFMPLNVLAGIGGMSEYSMMTQGIPWPVSYAAFTIGLIIVGWLTFVGLRHAELKKSRDSLSGSRKSNH
ncbi:MAG: CorA family divalent cation transporter [Gallionella sp.]|nr:CorA family divalent cation transporter [Gallionella sp.]